MAHSDEEQAQHSYEDSMADLKKEQADLEKTRAELEQKKEELEKETAGKLATEAYLEKIKPGCDFITEHFEYREESRGECKAKCIGQKEHVECKACLAEVTIPAYC